MSKQETYEQLRLPGVDWSSYDVVLLHRVEEDLQSMITRELFILSELKGNQNEQGV